MNQHTIHFSHPLPPIARSTDAGTSHAAAEVITASGRRQALMYRCLAVIADRGEHGATSGEVADALHLPHPDVWRRCSDLLNKGFVSKSGTRTWHKTNRAQAVLVEV